MIIQLAYLRMEIVKRFNRDNFQFAVFQFGVSDSCFCRYKKMALVHLRYCRYIAIQYIGELDYPGILGIIKQYGMLTA